MYLTISFQNGTKIVQTESRTSSSLECYAEVQPILCKDTRRKVVFSPQFMYDNVGCMLFEKNFHTGS